VTVSISDHGIHGNSARWLLAAEELDGRRGELKPGTRRVKEKAATKRAGSDVET
jgi:hypothetical protein